VVTPTPDRRNRRKGLPSRKGHSKWRWAKVRYAWGRESMSAILDVVKPVHANRPRANASEQGLLRRRGLNAAGRVVVGFSVGTRCTLTKFAANGLGNAY